MTSRATLRCIDDGQTTQAEAALVRDMLAGSRSAWREFHTRYDRLVHRCIARVAARFAAVMGEDDVAEITADLFAQLCADDMRRLRVFDAERGCRLSSWIGTLAVHAAHDHARALRSQPGRASLDEAEDIGADAMTPDQVVEMKEGIARVDEVLRALTDKDREFVSLYFDEGLDMEQIAERMQISIKTVYTKKHKIHARIEARLAA
jgi:RNA polymerase sigma-70 factor (ECF subfamily)